MIVRHPETGDKIGDVMISRDPEEIQTLLGLPRLARIALLQGSFETRENSYHVLPGYPFFQPDAIKLENMTAGNREREKKRPETANLI